jgi:hypothetical protein
LADGSRETYNASFMQHEPCHLHSFPPPRGAPPLCQCPAPTDPQVRRPGHPHDAGWRGQELFAHDARPGAQVHHVRPRGGGGFKWLKRCVLGVGGGGASICRQHHCRARVAAAAAVAGCNAVAKSPSANCELPAGLAGAGPCCQVLSLLKGAGAACVAAVGCRTLLDCTASRGLDQLADLMRQGKLKAHIDRLVAGEHSSLHRRSRGPRPPQPACLPLGLVQGRALGAAGGGTRVRGDVTHARQAGDQHRQPMSAARRRRVLGGVGVCVWGGGGGGGGGY